MIILDSIWIDHRLTTKEMKTQANGLDAIGSVLYMSYRKYIQTMRCVG